MYHFLFIVSKRLFPNGFDITKKVDLNKEQIINFCPKCNEELEDKKIITLRRHDQKAHPKTEKELVRRFYSRGSMPMFILIGMVIILAVIFFGSVNISNQLWEESLTEEENEFREFCSDLIDGLPEYPEWFWEKRKPTILERSEYIQENNDDFEKCYYTISYTSLGGKKERLEYFHSSNEK